MLTMIAGGVVGARLNATMIITTTAMSIALTSRAVREEPMGFGIRAIRVVQWAMK
jgi:hypothetical protein